MYVDMWVCVYTHTHNYGILSLLMSCLKRTLVWIQGYSCHHGILVCLLKYFLDSREGNGESKMVVDLVSSIMPGDIIRHLDVAGKNLNLRAAG